MKRSFRYGAIFLALFCLTGVSKCKILYNESERQRKVEQNIKESQERERLRLENSVHIPFNELCELRPSLSGCALGDPKRPFNKLVIHKDEIYPTIFQPSIGIRGYAVRFDNERGVIAFYEGSEEFLAIEAWFRKNGYYDSPVNSDAVGTLPQGIVPGDITPPPPPVDL